MLQVESDGSLCGHLLEQTRSKLGTSEESEAKSSERIRQLEAELKDVQTSAESSMTNDLYLIVYNVMLCNSARGQAFLHVMCCYFM